jgi:hypothetical protein
MGGRLISLTGDALIISNDEGKVQMKLSLADINELTVEAVANYRRDLELAGTATLPALFATAGAKFDMRADTLKTAVELMEKTIEELEAQSAH